MKGKNGNSNTFMRITNEDIYNKLIGLEEKINSMASRHAWTRRIAIGAWSAVIFLYGYIFLKP